MLVFQAIRKRDRDDKGTGKSSMKSYGLGSFYVKGDKPMFTMGSFPFS
jgi:hypothetical protein